MKDGLKENSEALEDALEKARIKERNDALFLEAFDLFREKYKPAQDPNVAKEIETYEIVRAISAHFPFLDSGRTADLVELLKDNGYTYRLAESFNIRYVWLVE